MQLQPAVKRLIVAVLVVGASAVIVRAQAPAIVAPTSVSPAFNLTVCPPPGGTVLPCSLFTSTAAVANGTTVETDLISYPMPAALSVNGQKVRITSWGSLANTANTKTVKVYFGATVVASLSGTTANTTFYTESKVIRLTATTQTSYGGVDFGSLTLFNRMTSTPAETLSGAVTIKMTGQSSAASGDVTSAGMFVEFVP